MAKAGKATSTDWTLREARDFVAKALGSKAGAEELLLEWMAAGELPWTCARWKAPTAADIAKWNQMLGVVSPTPQTVYRNGDSRFMADGPEIDWEDSSACEASYLPEGARARGIKVARARVLALLTAAGIAPAQQHQAEQQSSKSLLTEEVERRVAAGERYDNITSLSESLHEWMKTATNRPLKARTIENRLREWALWPLPSTK